MTTPDPLDGWTPQVQEQEQPPVFPDPLEAALTEALMALRNDEGDLFRVALVAEDGGTSFGQESGIAALLVESVRAALARPAEPESDSQLHTDTASETIRPAEPVPGEETAARAWAALLLDLPGDTLTDTTERDIVRRHRPLITAAIRASQEPGLDVERLARAMPTTEAEWRDFWHRVDDSDGWGWVVSIYGAKLAEHIARVYAALSEPKP